MKNLMKVLMLAMVLLVSAVSATEAAPKVGMIIDAPLYYINDEKVQTQLDEKCAALFPQGQFETIPVKETVIAAQLYREEHGLAGTVTNANGGEASYEWALKQDEIAELGRSLGCDYVFLLRVTGNSKDVASMFDSGIKASILFDARVLNMTQNKYTFLKQIVTESKSTKTMLPFNFSKPNYKKAFDKAMKKSLKELTIDITKI